MVNGVLAWVIIRVPLAWLFAGLVPGDLIGIGAAAPLATVCSVILSFFYLRTGKWKQSAIAPQEKQPEPSLTKPAE